MDLTPYVDALQRDLATAAAAGGEDARAVAERLTAALEPATRLMLLDALSEAAGEITRELAPGSVELRLRAGDPEFAINAAPAAEPAADAPLPRPLPADAEAEPSRASTCASPSSSRRRSSRPRHASGCRSTPG